MRFKYCHYRIHKPYIFTRIDALKNVNEQNRRKRNEKSGAHHCPEGRLRYARSVGPALP